jgi:hypothetical protein
MLTPFFLIQEFVIKFILSLIIFLLGQVWPPIHNFRRNPVDCYMSLTAAAIKKGSGYQS